MAQSASHFPHPSNDVAERMGGLVAIEELAGSKMYSGSPARLADLVKLLMEVFQPASDQQLMEFAARTLGHTVKAGGALMAGVVEEQVGSGWQGAREWGVGFVARLLAVHADVVTMPSGRRHVMSEGRTLQKWCEEAAQVQPQGQRALPCYPLAPPLPLPILPSTIPNTPLSPRTCPGRSSWACPG